MASDVRYVEHPQADLSGMISALNQMNQQVQQMGQEVVEVSNHVDGVESEFLAFMKEFRTFVEKDIKDRRMQEALQDRVELRQELDRRFSRHREIRKYVTGILQAADSSLVRQETIRNCTEELMVAVPHYWLAPALIALSAWLNNDRKLAEKAIHEAIARDDEKTSLLFCLICRRAQKNQAATEWLQRYFAMQDPMSVERKLIIVLDAYANGLFGPDSRNLCAQQIGAWIAELEDTVGFREEQISRWMEAIRGKIPGDDDKESYPYLAGYAKNWDAIQKTLRDSRLHGTMHANLEKAFSQPTGDLSSLKQQLDVLLNSLVSNFDEDELPIQTRLRMADLIVECKGDEIEAERRFDAEKSSFDEYSDLTNLLTNAAMNPELVHASVATQKLSLSTSRDWMMEAYENVAAENRMNAVGEISFEIEGYAGATTDGGNEADLVREATTYFEGIRDNAIGQVKQSIMDYFLLGAAAVLLVMGIARSLPIAVGLVAALLAIVKFFLGRKKVSDDIARLQEEYDEIIEKAGQIIRALCAEVIDMRRQVAQQETEYEPLMNYMAGIAPEQFIASRGTRNVHIA